MIRIAYLFVFAAFFITSCASLNSTIRHNRDNKYRVFVVNKQPARCQYVSSINGVGREAFEGNTKYTIPLAMTDLKRKTALAGANVVYIKSAEKQGYNYVVSGLCYKCRTIRVSKKRRKDAYRASRY